MLDLPYKGYFEEFIWSQYATILSFSGIIYMAMKLAIHDKNYIYYFKLE